jgi:hypothetical protein
LNYPMAKAILLNDNDVRVAVEFYKGAAFFHCRFGEHRIAAMKKLRAAMPRMKGLMLRLGFQFVHLFIAAGDSKLQRFCELVGFREVERKPDWILMRQEV